jgi:hypothetical protein
VRPKGEALAFGLFAGIALLGFALSFGIRGEKLEGETPDEHENGRRGEREEESPLV